MQFVLANLSAPEETTMDDESVGLYCRWLHQYDIGDAGHVERDVLQAGLSTYKGVTCCWERNI